MSNEPRIPLLHGELVDIACSGFPGYFDLLLGERGQLGHISESPVGARPLLCKFLQ